MDEKQRGGTGEKSSFRVTCTLLSQFLKTNRSYGDLNGIERLYQQQGMGKYSNQPPTTMNLFPGSDVSAGTKNKSNSKETKCPKFQREKETDAPLTIFYEGKVMVFENFPAMKAKNLMEMASRGKGIAVAGASAAPPQLPPETRASGKTLSFLVKSLKLLTLVKETI
nr:jasmonate ZIM domain protein 4 [Gastrodia elata]